MTQRQLPQEILEAFIDKMLSENVSDFHSFSEDYKDGDYVWTLEAQVYLPSDFRFEVKHTSITCWDEVSDEEVECSNYHSYELSDIIEERCFPYWTDELKEALEIKETEDYLDGRADVGRHSQEPLESPLLSHMGMAIHPAEEDMEKD